VLAWAKARDVSKAGFSSWSAYAKEHSPWGESRTREYLRLEESGLDVIREAVQAGALAVTVATRAPKVLAPGASAEEQIAWMERGAARCWRWCQAIG
jgi:hypothetical protein